MTHLDRLASFDLLPSTEPFAKGPPARSLPRRRPGPGGCRKRAAYQHLARLVERRGLDPAWAGELFRRRFGAWPRGCRTAAF